MKNPPELDSMTHVTQLDWDWIYIISGILAGSIITLLYKGKK